MSMNFETVRQRFEERQRLKRNGQIPVPGALYQIQVDFRSLPAEIAARRERESQAGFSLAARVLRVAGSWSRRPGLIGAILLASALPIVYHVGRGSVSPWVVGGRGVVDYDVRKLEVLLEPKPDDAKALESSSQLLRQYLVTHTNAHWFRVRLIQIYRVREGMAANDLEKQELAAFIQAQVKLLPSKELKQASEMPYQVK